MTLNYIKLIWAGICIAAATLSMTANATIIDQGVITLDTETNMEWLDLTETIGKSYNEVIGGYGNYIANG